MDMCKFVVMFCSSCCEGEDGGCGGELGFFWRLGGRFSVSLVLSVVWGGG